MHIINMSTNLKILVLLSKYQKGGVPMAKPVITPMDSSCLTCWTCLSCVTCGPTPALTTGVAGAVNFVVGS